MVARLINTLTIAITEQKYHKFAASLVYSVTSFPVGFGVTPHGDVKKIM